MAQVQAKPGTPAARIARQAPSAPTLARPTPEAVDGGPIAFVRDGDTIRLDVAHGTLELLVSDEELAARKEGWTPIPARFTKGVLGKYQKLVGSASKGAVLG